MYFSVMFFSVTNHQIVQVAIVVNLVYNYLTRGIKDPVKDFLPLHCYGRYQ